MNSTTAGTKPAEHTPLMRQYLRRIVRPAFSGVSRMFLVAAKPEAASWTPYGHIQVRSRAVGSPPAERGMCPWKLWL
jgi:hypothetical protein